MTIVIATLAVAFAAFCVGLTVRIVNRRERWAKWTLVGMSLVAAASYVLSYPWVVGVAIRNNDPAIDRVIQFYTPIVGLVRHLPESIRSEYSSYNHWCPSCSARLADVSKRSLHSFAAQALQALASLPTCTPSIGVNRLPLSRWLVDPDARLSRLPSRLWNVRAVRGLFGKRRDRLSRMITLVRGHVLDPHLAASLQKICLRGLDGIFQCLRVPLVGIIDFSRQDHFGLQVQRVLGFVGQMSRTVLHLGDAAVDQAPVAFSSHGPAERMDPDYTGTTLFKMGTLDQDFWERVFGPIHWIDRRIRRDTWTVQPVPQDLLDRISAWASEEEDREKNEDDRFE